MPTARDVLNGIKWGGEDLPSVRIEYVHRGAPDDLAMVDGSELVSLERSFMRIDRGGRATMIPYHRVQRIWRDDELVWQRERA